jgi:hypothetical protein
MDPLLERFAAAKEQKELAEQNLKAILQEMLRDGLAKLIEDSGSEFPDIIIVAPMHLLDEIDTYDFEDTSPTWLDEDGYPVNVAAHETVEWF